MNRRDFIISATAAVTAPVVAPVKVYATGGSVSGVPVSLFMGQSLLAYNGESLSDAFSSIRNQTHKSNR